MFDFTSTIIKLWLKLSHRANRWIRQLFSPHKSPKVKCQYSPWGSPSISSSIFSAELTQTNSLRTGATSRVQWGTMHVCRSAAKREQWRHRVFQSSGCCSHGMGCGGRGGGGGRRGRRRRVSLTIVYSNWELAGGRDLILRSTCLALFSPCSPKMFQQLSHFLPISKRTRSWPSCLGRLPFLLQSPFSSLLSHFANTTHPGRVFFVASVNKFSAYSIKKSTLHLDTPMDNGQLTHLAVPVMQKMTGLRRFWIPLILSFSDVTRFFCLFAQRP